MYVHVLVCLSVCVCVRACAGVSSCADLLPPRSGSGGSGSSAADSQQCVISFYPPIIAENLLPCPLEFNVWDLKSHQRVNKSTLLIQRGEEQPLHTIKFETLGITVRVAGMISTRTLTHQRACTRTHYRVIKNTLLILQQPVNTIKFETLCITQQE